MKSFVTENCINSIRLHWEGDKLSFLLLLFFPFYIFLFVITTLFEDVIIGEKNSLIARIKATSTKIQELPNSRSIIDLNRKLK